MLRYLTKHQITQLTQPTYSLDVAPCNFWLFPKLESPLKGKRFQTIDEIQENVMGQLMAISTTAWGPKVPALKGTEASLSYVQCFLYLVPSSINVSIFHITWLDTFWRIYISPKLCFDVLTSLADKHFELKEAKLTRSELVNKMNPSHILQKNQGFQKKWMVSSPTWTPQHPSYL